MNGHTVRRFRLSDKFISQYEDKEVPWGPVGYVTYKRTYARRLDERTPGALGTEEWHQTCRRVIEGMFDMQKQHVSHLGLEWNDAKAQKTAKEAYDRLFELKWTPPGRGLWMMGTKFVEERTAAGLFNCAFRSTKDISTKGGYLFRWMMDALMVGIGVGFDTLGAGTLTIADPIYTEDVHIIDDSREGWVRSVQVLLDGFLAGKEVPKFDYSAIRPLGAPIKGFGGTSSGYGPLKELHDNLSELLTPKIGEDITSVDIVDIENLIGRCVVAGNVRRSAALALGALDDKEYLSMKNDQEKLMHHRWGSNNSFHAKVGMDYTWHAEQSQKNGEPGYIWLDNARTRGRFKDPERDDDVKVMGFNPCFSGDTLIATADGRGAVAIKQLAEEGNDVPVYSLDPATGIVEIKTGRNPRLTGTDREVVEIVLDDDTTLRVTPEHKMVLLDGTQCFARDLVAGDSLPRLTKRLEEVSKGKKYMRVYCNTRDNRKDKIFEHRLIAQHHQPELWDNTYNDARHNGWVKGGLVVHHKDYDKNNNSPENLQIMTFRDHVRLHGEKDNSGENNPMFGKKHSEKTKRLIGEKTKERFQNPAFLEKLSRAYTEERRMNASSSMSRLRNAMNLEYYKAQESQTDLETLWMSGRLYAVKACEICHEEMVVSWSKRGQAYCSRSCANKKAESIAKRKEGQKIAFEGKQKTTLHEQIMAFKDLEDTLCRTPLKKEWESLCKERHIPYRIRKAGSSTNPHVLSSYSDLIGRSEGYNHRVKLVRTLSEKMDVYNISVEDNHTVGIVTDFNEETQECKGIYAFQCVEQQLEDAELCCLTETFPAKHDTYEDYLRTLKIAYLYGKTVTLSNTHWAETNAIMLKNRRIGLSQSGVIQAFNKHGRREMLNWCDNGYKFVQELDKEFSDWLCVPRSVRTTSIKPSGCLVPSQVIRTTEGNMSLIEIFALNGVDLGEKTEEHREWYEPTKDISVFDSENDEKRITKLFVNGFEQTIKFTMEDGMIIECTPEHKFLMSSGEWKKAADITEEDDFCLKTL